MSSRPSACPTIHLEDQLFVAILKTADILSQEADQLIKAAGLTGTQYNVLRILRGAEPDGLPCSGIGERMISRDPDMTRLLDRLESHNLITRRRQKEDRRVIKTRITPEGLKALKKLDQPVHDLHKRQFRRLTGTRLKQLAELLAEMEKREPIQRPYASNEQFCNWENHGESKHERAFHS
jgi:MarR family transcriptional regulator, organic hydroperoxide resistance regulator